MKILFLKPNNLADHIQPSLGYGYLAAQIRRHHDVAIHDCIKENTPIEKIGKIINQHDPDLIGIQCYTFDVPKVSRMLQYIKQQFPDKLTMVGGAHISSIPVESFRKFQPYVDYAFQGEGEMGFPKFLAALERGDKNFTQVEGLLWRDTNGEIRHNPGMFVHDLDALGYPAWDLMPPETYPES